MNWLKDLLTKAAGMGGGTIRVTTGLQARHLVVDPKGKEVIDGVRYREATRRVVKDRVVTTAFVNYIVANLIAELAAFGDFKFHHSGTGIVAEAASDTALGTPIAAGRDTGTQVEGASANIYKSIATTTYTVTAAITEHGLFNIATVGTLMDRTVFAAINVVDTNKIEWTFTIQFTAGG